MVIVGNVWVVSINKKIKGVASTKDDAEKLIGAVIAKYGFKKSLECRQFNIDIIDEGKIGNIISLR